MLDFRNKLFLAPMAGVSESVYRQLCRENGADVVLTEMISSEGILYNSEKTFEMAKVYPNERPIGIQLFGKDPDKLANGVKFIEDFSAPEYIDLNVGCPVKKVVNKNGGSALLKDPVLFGKICKAMVKASDHTPITVKIRSGWFTGEWVDTEIAKIAESEGISAIAVHPRSRSMGYSGNAFWERIKLVKESVSIPVIGNGDIVKPKDAIRMFNETNCDSVMLARATYGNPWIFNQIKDMLAGKEPRKITLKDKVKTAKRHYKLYLEHYGPAKANRDMKKNLAWYIKGFPTASKLRDMIFRAENETDMFNVLDIMQNLSDK